MARENFNIKVSLTDKQAAALCSDTANPIDRVQSVAQAAVANIADGGILIRESHRTRIEKVIGDIKDPETIVEAVEKSAGLSGENRIMSCILDPIFAAEMDEKAHVSGVPVNVLVTDLFTTALHMGLLCDMQTDRQDVYFSREQADFLRRRFEIPEKAILTGDLIARHLSWKPADEVDLFAEPQPVLAEA